MVEENTGVEEQDGVEAQEPLPEASAEATEPQDAEQEEKELSSEEKLLAKLKETLEVAAEDVGSLRKKLTITIPRETINEQMGEQFAELRREAAVPGFRRGRAPLRLVEKRFGNEVGDEIVIQLISGGLRTAEEKLELKTVSDPLIWVTKSEEVTDESGMHKTIETEKLVSVEEAFDYLPLPKEGDFTFICEVELRPQFELPELKGIPLTRPAHTVTDKDVEQEIKRLLSLRGRYASIEGKVEEDDVVLADVQLTAEGNIIDSKTDELLPARDHFHAGLLLTGLGEALKGQVPGGQITLEVTFPDDHETVNLRGKTGTFTATIKDVKRWQTPELDESFVSELGYENEAELRDTFRTLRENRLEQETRDNLHRQLTRHLLDHVAFELPEQLSKRQTDRLVARRMVEMYQAGLSEDEMKRQVDELRASAEKAATESLKLFFITEKIAEERDLSVDEEELNAAIAEIASRRMARFDRVRDELSKDNGLMSLYLQIRDAKVLDDLVESAVITEPEESAGPEKAPPSEDSSE